MEVGNELENYIINHVCRYRIIRRATGTLMYYYADISVYHCYRSRLNFGGT